MEKKEKHTEYKYKFKIPVFLANINIIFTNNVVKSRKKLDRKCGEWDNGDFAAMHTHDRKGDSYIILPTEATGRLIAHEALHCMNYIFKFLNSKGEEELSAYTLSYIVDEIEKFQHRRGFKRNFYD